MSVSQNYSHITKASRGLSIVNDLIDALTSAAEQIKKNPKAILSAGRVKICCGGTPGVTKVEILHENGQVLIDVMTTEGLAQVRHFRFCWEECQRGSPLRILSCS